MSAWGSRLKKWGHWRLHPPPPVKAIQGLEIIICVSDGGAEIGVLDWRSWGQRFLLNEATFEFIVFLVNFRGEAGKIALGKLPARGLASIYTLRDYSEFCAVVGRVSRVRQSFFLLARWQFCHLQRGKQLEKWGDITNSQVISSQGGKQLEKWGNIINSQLIS